MLPFSLYCYSLGGERLGVQDVAAVRNRWRASPLLSGIQLGWVTNRLRSKVLEAVVANDHTL
jgi:hypothetical protein